MVACKVSSCRACLSRLLRMKAHVSAPSFLVQVGEERCWSGETHGDRFTDFKQDMARVMDRIRKGLAVATEVIVGAIAALKRDGCATRPSVNVIVVWTVAVGTYNTSMITPVTL